MARTPGTSQGSVGSKTTKTATKTASKTVVAGTGTGKRGRPAGIKSKRGKRGSAASKLIPNFTIYIFRVLKQVHPTARISKTSMSIINRYAHIKYNHHSQRITLFMFTLGAPFPCVSRLTHSHHPLSTLPLLLATPGSFLNDIYEKISKAASDCVRYANKKTLDARSLQSAIRLILPGELAKHAVSEGTKAVTKYTAADQQ